jgi:hypothetical protein
VRLQVCVAGIGEHLFDSTLDAPNKAVAHMMVLSQPYRNFATASLVDRADKLVVCREGEKASEGPSVGSPSCVVSSTYGKARTSRSR